MVSAVPSRLGWATLRQRAASLPGMAFVTRSWLERAIREGWVQQAFDEENR